MASKEVKAGKRGKKAAGSRPLKVRLKTAQGRTVSSQHWLERQLNDPYVAAAKREGWRSRAAFKLLQIDEQAKLLEPGMHIVDLGAAPGGWSQVAAKKVRAGEPGGGQVIAIDISEMEPIPHVTILHADFMEDTAPTVLKDALGGVPADGVLSDMAAPATGHKQTDHLRIMALCEAAAAFAADVLKPGGFFLAKVLQGGAERSLLDALKRDFARVRHVKPAASRSDSSELYVLATGFRGAPAPEAAPRAARHG
jgi:23S rRNA (uridine2552-2'-O)-methyltransferase